MRHGPPPRKRPAPAGIAGITAFALSGGLFFFAPGVAAIPLGLFVLACLAAPFFPRAGFFLPVISQGRGGGKAVALTFDDGPDPRVTPRLLDLLERHGVTAAFFVIGRKAKRHPDLIKEILQRGHDIANHSTSHDPLLMVRSRGRLVTEIARTQDLLTSFGIRPLAFRPPVGVTNPRLGGVLGEIGMECVTFSCRACDFGNRRIGGLARKILGRVHPGAIILLHDVTPPGGGGIDEWLAAVEEIIRGLGAEGYGIVPLPVLTGRAVMERLSAPLSRGSDSF